MKKSTLRNVISGIGAGISLMLSPSAMADIDKAETFDYKVDRFADIQVLRYKVPGFEQLSLDQKLLIYYLTEAALSGRDIVWDQYGKYNLAIRDLMENVYLAAREQDGKSADFKALEKYLKQIEFGNGIHHHYSMDKFTPEFSRAYFDGMVKALPADKRPANLTTLEEVIFNPAVMAKRVNQADGQDLIATSAANIYEA